MKGLLLIGMALCVLLGDVTSPTNCEAQSINVALGGNFFFNPSTTNDLYGPGVGTELAGYFPLDDQISLGASAGYARNGLDGDGESLGFGGTATIDGGAQSVILATVRLQVKGEPFRRAPAVRALALVGVGLAYRQIENIDMRTQQTTITIDGESETNKAIIVGFGIQYRFSPTMGFYILPECHHIIVEGSDIQSIVPKLGLVVGRF